MSDPAPRGSGRLRWLFCFVVVLCLHGGVALALILHKAEPEAGPAENVVMMELAPVPVAPTDTPVETPPTEDSQAAIDPPVPEDKPEDKPVEEPQPEPDPPPVPDPPQVEPPPQAPSVVEMPQPKPKPRPKREEKKRTKASTHSPVSAPHVAAREAAPERGEVRNNAASAASWRSRLVAHLQRYKNYPSDARARGEQGTAVLSFSMNRSGRVTSAHIGRGSGSAQLDAATLAMIRSAQPLPAPPPDVAGNSFQFSVPIRYNIR